MVKTTAEAAGTNCTSGGVKLEYGLDLNENGTLDASEIIASLTKYVCNGIEGQGGVTTAGTGMNIAGTGTTADPYIVSATESDPRVPTGTAVGQMQYWNGTAWVVVAATPNEGATLQMIGGVPKWVGGTPPPTAPDAPTIGTATAGIGQASVAFTAPASNGGSIITSYTATSNPGNITGTISQAGGGTITLTGLTNGTTYTFTVTATNSAGTSTTSAASNSVKLPTVPDAPSIGTVTAGIGQASVPFTAPANNGGLSIISYTATSNPGNITGTISQAGGGTITVTGLTSGTAYTFTVTANNALGSSIASTASNSVMLPTVPDAPTIGTATAGAGQASVAFTAPPSNGGSSIISYTATSNPGNITGTISQAGGGTITVTGLTSGTAYTFTVTATNGVGKSIPSDASNSVTISLSAGEVYNPTTGKIWMDRNLGATQVASSSTDVNSYGDLYQWGRGNDGHQKRGSLITATLSTTYTPGTKFITSSTSPNDWRNPQKTNLWQGVNGVNNPCPSGYRVPTKTELSNELSSWSTNNAAGAFASPLKLPLAGSRNFSNGGINFNGIYGYYWSSTISGTQSSIIGIEITKTNVDAITFRAEGVSVRCIKD